MAMRRLACARARKALQGGARGAAQDMADPRVLRHLEGCEECRRVRDGVLALDGSLHRYGMLKPSGDTARGNWPAVAAGLAGAGYGAARCRLPAWLLAPSLAGAVAAAAAVWLGGQVSALKTYDRLAREIGEMSELAADAPGSLDEMLDRAIDEPLAGAELASFDLEQIVTDEVSGSVRLDLLSDVAADVDVSDNS